MIKKLKWDEQPEDVAKEVQNLIDRLVDAVNELQTMFKSCDNQIGILAEQIAKLQHDNSGKANCQENVQADPYAEQRKWIGKLCWFWTFRRENAIIGLLTDFEIDEPRFRMDELGWYEHCEPVKPDDDIIYKGE